MALLAMTADNLQSYNWDLWRVSILTLRENLANLVNLDECQNSNNSVSFLKGVCNCVVNLNSTKHTYVIIGRKCTSEVHIVCRAY